MSEGHMDGAWPSRWRRARHKRAFNKLKRKVVKEKDKISPHVWSRSLPAVPRSGSLPGETLPPSGQWARGRGLKKEEGKKMNEEIKKVTLDVVFTTPLALPILNGTQCNACGIFVPTVYPTQEIFSFGKQIYVKNTCHCGRSSFVPSNPSTDVNYCPSCEDAPYMDLDPNYPRDFNIDRRICPGCGVTWNVKF